MSRTVPTSGEWWFWITALTGQLTGRLKPNPLANAHCTLSQRSVTLTQSCLCNYTRYHQTHHHDTLQPPLPHSIPSQLCRCSLQFAWPGCVDCLACRSGPLGACIVSHPPCRLENHHFTHLVGKGESQSKLVDGSSLGVTSSSNSHGGSGSTPDGGSSNRKHCVVVSARCRVESGSIFNVVGFEREKVVANQRRMREQP